MTTFEQAAADCGIVAIIRGVTLDEVAGAAGDMDMFVSAGARQPSVIVRAF